MIMSFFFFSALALSCIHACFFAYIVHESFCISVLDAFRQKQHVQPDF